MNNTALLYAFSLLLVATLFQACAEVEDPKQVPTSFTINSISLEQYPSTNSNGNNWDAGTSFPRYPDCYLTLYNNISVPPTPPRITPIKDNVSSSTSFSLISPYTINDFDANWVLRLYDDDDTAGSEFMGEITFTVNDNLNYNGSDTPSPVITFNQGPLRVTLVGYFSY